MTQLDELMKTIESVKNGINHFDEQIKFYQAWKSDAEEYILKLTSEIETILKNKLK